MRFSLRSRDENGCYGDKCSILLAAVPLGVFCLMFWLLGLL